MKIFQKGFNYSQDGPGNRLVYHLQGCNLHCPWCSNPEGLSTEGVILVDEKWIEDYQCPKGAVVNKVLDREKCKICVEKSCIRTCRSKGLRFSCEEISKEQVLDAIEESRAMFYDGGGVTFTGGECTLQFGELLWLAQNLQKLNINVCIETNGTHPNLKELISYLDYIIIDCKLIDSDRHKRWTGIDNTRILQNIRQAVNLHPHVLIRVPVIGGVNDSEKDMDEFLEFFMEITESGNRKNVSVELLKYHEFGKRKWEQCSYTYRMTNAAKISDDVIKKFQKRITDIGLQYIRT